MRVAPIKFHIWWLPVVVAVDPKILEVVEQVVIEKEKYREIHIQLLL